jgi:valyl-tRNA synthetase
MFKDGLIYRGKRLVNWDTFLQTAVSDDEVFHEVTPGYFWHFSYPVIDPKEGEPKQVTIATTRPETMLGDTAVAVHPDPEKALERVEAELREKLAAAPAKEKDAAQSQLDALAERRTTMLPHLLQLRDMALDGRLLMLPLVDRPIPLVADQWAKPELGSGCVKITPAHDPNDYEVGKRHDLPMINILNPEGTLNENAGAYEGQKVLDARKNVVADLEKLGLLGEIEDREIDLAHSDRSKTPIEPYLADQWFVKMDKLSQSAMDAVSDGRVKITPTRYAKGYLDWLSEKRDWPVSRQLWWGHQIPVWQVTLEAHLYQPETGSTTKTLHQVQAESLRQVQEEFREALNEFAVSCGCGDEIATTQSETSEPIYYLCAKTHKAETELRKLYRRHHRARVAGLHDESPPIEPPLVKDDPRCKAEEKLWTLIARMNDQEQDVLDTWFSSALWPHSTLGWPEETPELDYYYPTSTLITSRDIITLWVARMVLSGLYNRGEVPFSDVYIHPKILDGYGETMSKSKGNGVDPFDVINKFGADALRFGICYITTEAQDVRMPVEFECPHCQALVEQTKKNRTLPRITCTKCGKEFSTQWARNDSDDAKLPRGAVVSERFELGRNFCNKLWNASRFALMNLEGFTPGEVTDDQLLIEDRWILSRLATVSGQVTECFDGFRYAEAARTLYDFAWDEFCSFYIEMTKSRLQDDASRPVAQRVLAHTLDALLRLLHPVIPFLTEEVWQRLGAAAPQRGLTSAADATESVMIAAWPTCNPAYQNAETEERFAVFQEVLKGIREVRARQNIVPKAAVHFSVRADAATIELLKPMEPYFQSMAGAEATAWGSDTEPPTGAAQFTAAGATVFVDLAEHIDVEAEIAKTEKERTKLQGFIAGKEKKLGNENFVARAPEEVVKRERESLEELRSQLASLEKVLAELKKQV